jgi:hypothetical protein
LDSSCTNKTSVNFETKATYDALGRVTKIVQPPVKENGTDKYYATVLVYDDVNTKVSAKTIPINTYGQPIGQAFDEIVTYFDPLGRKTANGSWR